MTKNNIPEKASEWFMAGASMEDGGTLTERLIDEIERLRQPKKQLEDPEFWQEQNRRINADLGKDCKATEELRQILDDTKLAAGMPGSPLYSDIPKVVEALKHDAELWRECELERGVKILQMPTYEALKADAEAWRNKTGSVVPTPDGTLSVSGQPQWINLQDAKLGALVRKMPNDVGFMRQSDGDWKWLGGKPCYDAYKTPEEALEAMMGGAE